MICSMTIISDILYMELGDFAAKGAPLSLKWRWLLLPAQLVLPHHAVVLVQRAGKVVRAVVP